MRYLLISFVLLAFCIGCKKETTGLPTCITEKVADFKTTAPTCPDVRVSQYTFQGNTVYMFYLESCCCDNTSEILDSECNSLGFLGGITGNTEINGVHFLDNAVFVKDIWKQ